MKFSCLFLLITLQLSLQAQNAKPAVNNLELTTTDITKQKNVNGLNISFFGLKMGMSKADAIKKLDGLAQFKWEYDEFNTGSKETTSTEQMRIYVHLAAGEGANTQTVLYLIWKPGSAGMSSLVFFIDAALFVVGNTKKLFSKEPIKSSGKYLSFLTETPVKTTTSYGVTTWVYKNQHFKRISNQDDDKTETWFGVE